MSTVRLIVIWLLAVLLIGGAYVVSQTQGGLGGLIASTVPAIKTDTVTNQNGTSLEEVWSPFCAAGESHILLSTPQDASFTMGAGPGADACMELGNAVGHKLLLCRGQGPARFPITVRNAANTQTYIIELADC